MTDKMSGRLVKAYVAIAICLAWPLTAGVFFHDAQAIYLQPYDGVHEYQWAQEHRRSNLGMAVATGALYSAIWPIGVPLAFAVTGFAEHGIFHQARGEASGSAR